LFLLVARVFAIVLALVAISKSYVDFRGRRESPQMFLLWTLIWISIVFVGMFPDLVAILVSAGGGSVGIGTFLGMVIVFLFFLVYRMYVRVEVLEQKLTVVVRELALRAEWESEAGDADRANEKARPWPNVSSE
jgi:hypothetical protein